jgi:tRNA (guanine37-N1)-methyltransferase
MIRFDIISIVPDLLISPFDYSILKRAKERNLIEVNVIPLRPFGLGKHLQVDDYQYGGGAGLVMMCEPLVACIESLLEKNKYDEIIFLTPDGETFNQKTANSLSLKKNLLLICGHYKGIDQRIRDLFVTKEISIGDYVLSGGELGAAVIVDAIARLVPGVLNDETSALSDTFQDDLLAPPVYTRPADFRGLKVPDVLLSGHERKIHEWRYEQAIERTKERRPDLLKENEE